MTNGEKNVPLEYNRFGMPVERGLSVASMSLCEELHLTANGCSEELYDEGCMDCPFNPYAKPEVGR